MELTLAAVLTVTGAAASAAVISLVIQLAKSVIPALDSGPNAKKAALFLSAVLVVLAVVSSGVFDIAALFAAFLAWLGIAKLATDVYDEVTGNDRIFEGGGVDSP